LYGCEVEGVPALVEALRQWYHAAGGADVVPPDVPDPTGACVYVLLSGGGGWERWWRRCGSGSLLPEGGGGCVATRRP
jgi:pimeloyl-ACP methyl ester carboxylesterase